MYQRAEIFSSPVRRFEVRIVALIPQTSFLAKILISAPFGLYSDDESGCAASAKAAAIFSVPDAASARSIGVGVKHDRYG